MFYLVTGGAGFIGSHSRRSWCEGIICRVADNLAPASAAISIISTSNFSKATSSIESSRSRQPLRLMCA